MTPLLVVLGAAVGAPLRYLADRHLNARFPWGTVAVNVAGSAILGGLVAAAPSAAITALVGTGFCGALTTFSTFGHQVFRLVEQRAFRLAAANVVGSVTAGVAAAILGYAGVAALT